jgi:hypothetical protein
MARRLRGLLIRCLRPWVVARDNPARSKPLAGFRLFCVLGAWYEGDVIGATVKNALAQGCDRVYLVDNNSPDNTVAEARAAGAQLAESFVTETCDELQRMEIMNRVVSTASQEEDAEHIWWLWLDADEFPHGPMGMTLKQYLQSLDARFRIVGTRSYNHYPGELPHYIPGYHPLDFQPLCEEFLALEFGHCASGHWKHPLQRYDRGEPEIVCAPGFHRAICANTRLLEPVVPIVTHHFPYRDREFTVRRLEALCAPDGLGNVRNVTRDRRVGGVSGITKRFRSLDMVYAGRWNEVDNLHKSGSSQGVHPRPWEELVDCEDRAYKVWYTPEEVERARAEWPA